MVGVNGTISKGIGLLMPMAVVGRAAVFFYGAPGVGVP